MDTPVDTRPRFMNETCEANEEALKQLRDQLANQGYKVVEVNRGKALDSNGLTSHIYEVKAKRLDPDKWTGMQFAD